MSEKVDELRSNLQGRLDAAEEGLNGIKASLEKARSGFRRM